MLNEEQEVEKLMKPGMVLNGLRSATRNLLSIFSVKLFLIDGK